MYCNEGSLYCIRRRSDVFVMHLGALCLSSVCCVRVLLLLFCGADVMFELKKFLFVLKCLYL